MIKLFDLQNGVIIPTEHCYTNKSLKNIMDNYPEDYPKIYTYLFYMYCPDDTINCYFNIEEYKKEDTILKEIGAKFCTDDRLIYEAKEFCKLMYWTATAKAFFFIKKMIEDIAEYMQDTCIRDGKDGNVKDKIAFAEKYKTLRKEYNEAYKELAEENGKARGNKHVSYDQRRN